MEALGIDVLFKGTNMMRLLQGLWIAVQISGISVALSLVLGVLLGIFMMWENPVAACTSRLSASCRSSRCSTLCSSARRACSAST